MQHAQADLAHYAKACTDIEFQFAHGWGELWGIANRSVLAVLRMRSVLTLLRQG